jgi:hypothetical protein
MGLQKPRPISFIHEQLQQPDQTLERLMGGELDATKTISILTLFEAAGLPLRLDADPAQRSERSRPVLTSCMPTCCGGKVVL